MVLSCIQIVLTYCGWLVMLVIASQDVQDLCVVFANFFFIKY